MKVANDSSISAQGLKLQLSYKHLAPEILSRAQLHRPGFNSDSKISTNTLFCLDLQRL